MSTNEETRNSKFLSLVLRHKPEEIGLALDSEGWALVDELLTKSNQKGIPLTLDALTKVVENSDKKRFTFSDDFTRIRANQGHSIDVDLKLSSVEPPSILYHGTAEKNMASILENGLLKQARHHVHLSSNPETACTVGKRYGTPVILEIAALEMHDCGYPFFISKNEVWLTDHVPVKFIHLRDVE
jgi:putative RNA 2'-phosphotransferase